MILRNYSTNRKTIYNNDYESGGFGFDIYFFTIYTNKVLDTSRYTPKGKLLRVENCSFSFEYDGGHAWALMYILIRELQKKDNILNLFKIEIRNDTLFIDNVEIAYIVKYIKEESYTLGGGGCTWHRTIFNATFDIFMSEDEIVKLICNKYKELTNYYFKGLGKCDSVKIEYNFDHGSKILIKMSNNFEYEIRSNWYILNADNIQRFIDGYKLYEYKRKYIILPSGRNIELLNENEMNRKVSERYLYSRWRNGDFYATDIIDMMLKYDKIRDLSEDDILFLSFKLYRLYPEVSAIQSLVL